MSFSIFKKKQKKTDPRYRYLTVQDVSPVASDAVKITFEIPTPPMAYQAGQFITLIDEIKGKKIRRAYSLCSSPVLDENPAVIVKRVPGGLMSNHINDTYKKGLQIEAMNPMGLFTTTIDPANQRKIILFGGGSGITPLFSLLTTILHVEPKTTIHLVYGNRQKEFIIFKDELEKLDRENERFHLHYILEENPEGLAAYSGRPTQEMITKIVADLGIDQQSELFICGPQPMMDVLSEGLIHSGIHSSQLHLESFVPVADEDSVKENNISATEEPCEATILLDGESYSLTLDKSKTILQQALEKNLDMPYSCQSGLCTACRAKCLEGEISIAEAEGLTQEEIEEGFVLTCVGKPLSNVIRIDMG
ncbi:MAG: ferredoxin--NADP reductase [Cyclobacteriaceae bacterium]|nr:ferredoxin--NADP reductase [Cyclobacteriaceae bacterium]